MKTELRKLIATWAMNFTLWILPDCEFKRLWAKFHSENIMKL